VARFRGTDKYIGIISRESQAKEKTIPLWQIGAGKTVSDTDEFGISFSAHSSDGDLNIEVPENGALIIKVE
jgi:hypothetical protein